MVTNEEYKVLLSDCKKVGLKYKIREEEVQDILHDVYLRSYNKEVKDLRNYFYVSFINECNSLHKKVRTNELTILIEETYLENIEINEDLIMAEIIIDTVDNNVLANIPEIDKQMFRMYFLKKLSFYKTARHFKINHNDCIEKVHNLVKYLCLINISKFFTRVSTIVNHKQYKKIMQHSLKKVEYLKYAECITSAHFGYSFNFDLFKKSALSILNITINPNDKYNRELLKQAAKKLFDELYTTEDKVEIPKTEIPSTDEDKDTTTSKPKRVSSKSNKKPL